MIIMGIIRYLGKLLTRPFVGAFYLYLALLWLLNIADVIQTLMLSQGGHLKLEANQFMNIFLQMDWRLFIIAKFVPMMLVSVMLIRGYTDNKGTKIGGIEYTHEDVRHAILLLLATGVVYYLIIVLIPFITILISLAIQK